MGWVSKHAHITTRICYYFTHDEITMITLIAARPILVHPAADGSPGVYSCETCGIISV